MFNRAVFSLLAVSSQAVATTAGDPVGVDLLDGSAIIRMVLGLAVIVSLIAVGAWLLRRYPALRGAEETIKAIAALNLSGRERVLLVEVDGIRLLLGISSGHIQTLHVFDSRVPETSFTEALHTVQKKAGHGF